MFDEKLPRFITVARGNHVESPIVMPVESGPTIAERLRRYFRMYPCFICLAIPTQLSAPTGSWNPESLCFTSRFRLANYCLRSERFSTPTDPPASRHRERRRRSGLVGANDPQQFAVALLQSLSYSSAGCFPT